MTQAISRALIVADVTARLLAEDVQALRLDEIKDLADSGSGLPDMYVEVHLEVEGNGATLNDGTSDLTSWVLVLVACGKTVANAELLLDRAAAALYGERISRADGEVSTPMQRQPGDSPDQERAGYYAASDEYTFTF